MKERKRSKRKICILLAIIICVPILMISIATDNKTLEFTEYHVNTQESNTVKVMQLSDMHFPKCKVNTDKIIEKIEEEQIDIIAITGDFIDSSAKVSSCGALSFIEKLGKYDHVFFVTGNHEVNNKEYQELKKALQEHHIQILENSYIELTIRGIEISVMGLEDNIEYSTKYFDGINPSSYKLMLAHRPEKYQNYISSSYTFNPDLTLTGHAHGGQIRFGNHGLIAPNQGLNPKYVSGIYSCGENKMLVSRGIGNSILPWRIGNKPEAPIISIGF